MEFTIEYYGRMLYVPEEFQDGYIATDKDGRVSVYWGKPIKASDYWDGPCKIIGNLNTTILEKIGWENTLERIQDLRESQSRHSITDLTHYAQSLFNANTLTQQEFRDILMRINDVEGKRTNGE